MPSINDYVNYGTYGICKIEDIQFMKFDSRPEGQNYYILKPIHEKKSVVFVPTDNPKLLNRMRPVLSPDEVDKIILSVKDEDSIWVSDRKKRAIIFQSILAQRDERELMLLASSLYQKSKERAKGLPAGEFQILKKAETIIEQEFAFSLKINAQSVGEYIREKLEIDSAPVSEKM